MVEDPVQLYEIETISEVDDTLIFKLKHFNKDLTGWEEKDKTVDFALVKVTKNKVYLNGLTLERINDNEISIYVAIEDSGNTTEEKFNYKRVE